MSATQTVTCSDCGSENVTTVFEDEQAGDAGAFTLVCEDCPHELHVPAEAKSRDRITALRAIVDEHAARRIDGYIVDAMTAQLLIKVYEALSPANRERFGKPELGKLVDLAWKCAR